MTAILKLRMGAIALLLSLVPSWAVAYDGTTEGRINVIQYGTGDFFNFTLVGEPRLCSTGSPFSVWGVVGDRAGHSPEARKQMLSAVTAAYLSGRSVRVYTDNLLPDGSCKATVIELLPW